MTTIRCQALLFDMDGVLVDSTDAVARVWRKWAIERGFDPEKVVRAAHGRQASDTVRDFSRTQTATREPGSGAARMEDLRSGRHFGFVDTRQ